MAETERQRRTERDRQKERTRAVIVGATRRLAETGGEVTFAAVAAASEVSVATVYRHFSDLLELLGEALDQLDVDDVMTPVAAASDPVERVAHAAEVLARRVAQRRGAVRAVIAATIARPRPGVRPGHRFALIDRALAPWSETADPTQLEELRRTLSIVMGAEAFFVLTDLHGLSTEQAISSVTEAARAVTSAATDSRPADPPRTRDIPHPPVHQSSDRR